MDSKKIKMSQNFIIGPSNPDSFVFFNGNFSYQNKNHTSLFHAGIGHDFNDEFKKTSSKVAHDEFVKRCSVDIVFILGLSVAFGAYSFKYHEDIKKILKSLPKDQHIYIEGLQKSQYRMYIIEDMRDEVHKTD